MTYYIYEGAGFTAHCIFVMKYWVVAKKIEQIFGSTTDSNLEFRAKIYLYLLLIWIVLAMTLNVCFFWIYSKKVWDKWYKMLGLITVTPPLVYLAFLCNAFFIMKRHEGSFQLS